MTYGIFGMKNTSRPDTLSVSSAHRMRWFSMLQSFEGQQRGAERFQTIFSCRCRFRFLHWRSSGGLRNCWTALMHSGTNAELHSPSSTLSSNPSFSISSGTQQQTPGDGTYFAFKTLYLHLFGTVYRHHIPAGLLRRYLHSRR